MFKEFVQIARDRISDTLFFLKNGEWEPLPTSSDNGGPGGSATLQEDILYAALVVKINAGTLVKGQQYKITDYATKHYIVDAAGTQYLDSIITGVNEALVVCAISANEISKLAYSVLHPEDIIHYDWNPANWLDDKSFADLSGAPAIVTGFKGVIYFRHDTLLDNYTGYDFRNCKFRRWKTNVAAWGSGSTYSKNDFTNYSGFIYFSIQDSNINHQPDTANTFWIRLLDLSKTEYYLNNPTNQNGIPSDNASFIDVKTFAEGIGSAVYSNVVSTHFESFKDNSTTYDNNGILLSNNVIFLQDDNFYCSYANSFGQESSANTFIGSKLASISTGNYFHDNIIGADFGSNRIDSDCGTNIIGQHCKNNIIGSLFRDNKIADDCQLNSIAPLSEHNRIGNAFVNNYIQSAFNNSYIKNGFQQNIIMGSSSVDYVTATHVYGTYNTTIFIRQDDTAKLSYCNNSDVLTVVNANA